MLNTVDDTIDFVKIQLSSAASTLTTEGLEAAVNKALAELGWSLPIDNAEKEMWLVIRAARHACYILWIASAQKFKYKQVNLQHRFEHYEKLIKHMDSEFDAALSANSTLFSNIESYKLFGTAVGAGFAYDDLGQDITYDNLILFINSGE